MRTLTSKLVLIAAIASLFLLAPSPLRAENSRVFMNSGDILRAQSILVQDRLLAEGSYTPGILDSPTRQALSQYQSAHSLNVSGDLDDETFQSLTSHEMGYPWDSEPRPVSTAAGVKENAAPAEARSEPQVAEAPAVPQPEPARAEMKEAPTPSKSVPAPAGRMPATASRLPALVLLGLGLIGAGALLLKSRAA